MQNPLKNHLSDSVYNFLLKNNLLREKGIRDYHIRKRFCMLKEEFPSHIVIEMLQNEFPYLQYETIRKIVYQKPNAKPLEIMNLVTY